MIAKAALLVLLFSLFSLEAISLTIFPPVFPAPSPFQVPKDAHDSLEIYGWCAIKDWAPYETTAGLLKDAIALRNAGKFIVAGVGSRRLAGSGEHASVVDVARVSEDIRRSEACWLYPPPDLSLGNPSERAALKDRVEGLRTDMRSHHGLALEPFETELSYLWYPKVSPL